MKLRVAGGWMVLAVLAGGVGVGCGDDAATGDDGTGDTVAGEACLSPGAGGTCLCETMVQGTRRCGTDGYWTACSCPPVSGDPNNCRDGEKFMCPSCSGSGPGMIVECPPTTHKIECPCGGPGDGGMTDAMTVMPVDAGHDAGHDAADGSDAG